jgi:exodeoxyribonuclease-3
MERSMKLVSWNVNGIRACLKKGFLDFAAASDADVICLQEVRARPEQVELDLPGYTMHWNPALKRGYSGTAILTRQTPRAVFPGIDDAEHDTEGRVLTAEFDDYFVVTVYTPNAQRELTRLEYREKRWDPDFRKFLKKLEKTKPVVFCGDLNVAHKEIDLKNPKPNRGNAGFTDEERAGFDRLLKADYVDTFRIFESGGDHFTWWSNRPGVRERNVGWRIDYFMVSEAMKSRVRAAGILPEVLGSDHCPITLDLI